jgi:hypothetical protein
MNFKNSCKIPKLCKTQKSTNCFPCLSSLNEVIFRGCKQQLHYYKEEQKKTIKKKVDFNTPNGRSEIEIIFEDIDNLQKYELDNKDKFDLLGFPLVTRYYFF